MDKYLKKFKVTDYGHCIIKEELIISEDEETDGVDVEAVAESIDDSFMKVSVELNGPVGTSKSHNKRKRNGSLKNKNDNTRNDNQSVLDLFLKAENPESTKESEIPKNITNDEKSRIIVKAASSDDLDTLYKKLAKSHCHKCNIKRAVICGKARCPKCETQLTYSCLDCDKTYRRFSHLGRHMKDQHTSQPTTNREIHVCPMCNKTFSQRSGMLKHQRIQHGITDESGSVELQCAKCSKKFKSTQKKEHERVCLEEAPFKCDKCPFASYQLSKLKRHTFETHTEFKEQCENCDKIFTNAASMSRHLRVYCGKEKHFECHHCGRKFYQKYDVLDHLDQIHFEGSLKANTTDDLQLPRICEYCDETLERHEEMSKHLKRCKSSPFCVRTCKYCGLTLRSREWMKKHLGRCESAPADLRVECEIADQPDLVSACKNLSKAYYENCKAKTPAKKGQSRCKKCDTRTIFTCERCTNISFKDLGQLRRHLRLKHVKSNESYRCDKCDRSYRQLTYLKNHQKTRHPSDPSTKNEYECSKCGENCHNKQSLGKHRISCLEHK